MSASSTDEFRPAVRAFVVRSADGEVVHVHQEVTFGDGGRLPDGESAEQRATRLAGERGRHARVDEVSVEDLPKPGFLAPDSASGS